MKDALSLFYDNIKLAYHISHKFNQDILESDDVKQLALLGLWKACKTYKASEGYAFSTYAITCMNNQILMEMRRPLRQREKFRVLSYDNEVDDSEGLFLIDTIADPMSIEENIADSDIYNNVKTIISELSKREQVLLRLYFFDGYNQREISSLVNLSQANVSRIINKSLLKIRRKYKEKYGGIE